ncbi:GntR family transcriptional regulator [Saccharopolyspora taberi]|uniref:GntR family transcriptional regulator n=1 Tax=Saccharopolyspora taberi TaxID=60895 RepID=A0ABN3VE06_9PSEU
MTTARPGSAVLRPDVLGRRRRADRARQVAEVIRRQIDRGDFPQGHLPDERELGAEFGMSRNTIREALELLRGEGLIERVPGLGTRVSTEKYAHPLDHLRGLAETMRPYGGITNEVRTAGPIRPPRSVADRLRLPAGSPVIYLERLRRLDGLPLSVDLTYLVPEIGEQLIAHDLRNRDVFGLIEQICGQPLGTAEVTLEAVNADAHSAAMLGLPLGGAMLVAERFTRLADGSPVDLEFLRFRGDRMTMNTVLHRPAREDRR